MLQNKIKALTEQLDQIRISQDHLREQERLIVQAIIETYEETAAQQNTADGESKPPGRDTGKEPASKDHKPRSSKAAGATKSPTTRSKEEISIGARVRIRNPKPSTGASTLLESDTKGTVIRKSKFFIFVNTDNPRSTQHVRCSRSNIELLD